MGMVINYRLEITYGAGMAPLCIVISKQWHCANIVISCGRWFQSAAQFRVFKITET